MKNNSGFMPLILPDKTKLLVHICALGEQTTKGGIIIEAKNVEDDAYAATNGSVVEVVCLDVMGNLAKTNVKLGEKVTFRPYAGIHIVGHDRHAYRLLEGREIHAKELTNNEEK